MYSQNSRWAVPSPVRRYRLLVAVALLSSLFLSDVGRAELNPQQKQQVTEIAKLVREAGVLFQAGDFGESGKRIESAMTQIDSLIEQGGPEAYDAVAPAFGRIVNAHALLELEGIALRPFERPRRPEMAAKAETPANSKPDKTPETPDKTPARRPKPQRGAGQPDQQDAGPSFVRQIGPLLVQHCGRCHINRTQGNFSMANFAMLAQGPPEGTVIFPGDPVGSRLIETIETGDMPRGGTVPAAHLQLLKDWVSAGAKYDGNSPLIPLVSMAANAPPLPTTPDMPAPATPTTPTDPSVRPPTGSETVSFAKDVAPLLLKNCNGCHIDAMQTRGGLRMDNFGLLIRGGDSGEIVLPNRAAASLLIRKLKGEEGQRMPANRPPLSDEQITLISRWIDENATFDGPVANQPLSVLAQQAWAASASDEELSERRQELAKKNLGLVAAGSSSPTEVESDRFLVIGNVGDATAAAVLAAADKVSGKIKSTIDLGAIRGRITIYALPKRYDYSEFAKMAESRSVPSDWQSHWRHDGVDAYIAMVAGPGDSDAMLEARLTGPLTSLAVATRGADIPRWLSEGVGRATTARLYARGFPAVDAWNQGLLVAVSGIRDGKQVVENGLAPEQTDLVGYAIATLILKSQRRQYDSLLKNLDKGDSFADAFTSAFGGSPAEFIDRWKPALAGGGRRRN